MARQYYYVERVAAVQVTSSTFVDVTGAVLTFTPDASSTYLIVWSALARDLTLSIGNPHEIRLRDDTAGTTLSLHRGTCKDTSDFWSRGGIAFFTSGASPVSQTFSLEHASFDNTTTIATKEARIIAIKL